MRAFFGEMHIGSIKFDKIDLFSISITINHGYFDPVTIEIPINYLENYTIRELNQMKDEDILKLVDKVKKHETRKYIK